MVQKKSLEEKISQMLIVGFNGMRLSPQDEVAYAIKTQHLGGVILFDYNFKTRTYARNIETPQQLHALTHTLQAYAKEAGAAPLWIGVDYEGGKVNRLHERYGFPATLSAEDMGKRTQAVRLSEAKKMAATLYEAGINLNFAPVLDVNLNPENPVIGKIGRSFSADPTVVVDCAAIVAKAYAERGIVSVYKHFPGQGSARVDTHVGLADVTDVWQAAELIPYQQLLSNVHLPAMVMTAHVVHAGLDPDYFPASLSFKMTQTLLREQLQFNGVVVTDDMQMQAVTAHYGQAEAIILAINAGADVLVFGNQLVETPVLPSEIVEMVIKAIEQKKISQQRIDEAYARVMKLKACLI